MTYKCVLSAEVMHTDLLGPRFHLVLRYDTKWTRQIRLITRVMLPSVIFSDQLTRCEDIKI